MMCYKYILYIKAKKITFFNLKKAYIFFAENKTSWTKYRMCCKESIFFFIHVR